MPPKKYKAMDIPAWLPNPNTAPEVVNITLVAEHMLSNIKRALTYNQSRTLTV